MATNVTLNENPDGSNLLSIDGTRPGPHYALVRGGEYDRILNHLFWDDDDPVRLLLPGVIDKVNVQIDQDREHPEDADYKGEEFSVELTPLGSSKRKRDSGPPLVRVAADTRGRAVIEPGNSVLLAEEPEPDPLVPVPDMEGKELEEALALQHKAAESPHEVTEPPRAPVLRPPPGTQADPVTAEEKEEQHERAEFPTESDTVSTLRTEQEESLEITERRAAKAEERQEKEAKAADNLPKVTRPSKADKPKA